MFYRVGYVEYTEDLEQIHHEPDAQSVSGTFGTVSCQEGYDGQKEERDHSRQYGQDEGQEGNNLLSEGYDGEDVYHQDYGCE